MKKILLPLIAFFIITSASSQSRERVENLPNFDNRKLHYGFYLGLNKNDFKIDYRLSNVNSPSVITEVSPGFNVGLIADLRLHKNINLRFEPGLMSNSKKLHFSHLSGSRDSIRDISSTYLHLPLILKLSSNRWNNIRPYVLGGLSYDYNFSSNEKNSDDNYSGEFRTMSSNFMYEVGVGIDIYLYYFKFSPSIRAVFALNRELKDDNNPNSPWTSPIENFATRGVFLSFAFE